MGSWLVNTRLTGAVLVLVTGVLWSAPMNQSIQSISTTTFNSILAGNWQAKRGGLGSGGGKGRTNNNTKNGAR
jgi:hypothetical protein